MVLCRPISPKAQEFPLNSARAEGHVAQVTSILWLYSFPSCSLEADGGIPCQWESTRLGHCASVVHRGVLNWFPCIANAHLDSRGGLGASALGLPLYLTWESVPHSLNVSSFPTLGSLMALVPGLAQALREVKWNSCFFSAALQL